MKFFIILFSRPLCVFLFCRFDTPVHHMVASKARFGENASRRLLRDVASRDRPVCQPCHVIITSRHSLPIFRRKPSQRCVCHFWRLGIDLDLSLFVSLFCVLQKGKAIWLTSQRRKFLSISIESLKIDIAGLTGSIAKKTIRVCCHCHSKIACHERKWTLIVTIIPYHLSIQFNPTTFNKKDTMKSNKRIYF